MKISSPVSLKIDVIIPCYNEGKNIRELWQQLSSVMDGCAENYFILFVDDGSHDGTLAVLRDISSENERVGYLSFSRNFGHQNALRAGLDSVEGDVVIMMDGDLQHPPELIPMMIKQWRKGNDVVYTVRKDVKEAPVAKRLTSRCFYHLFSMLSGTYIRPGMADFRLISRDVLVALRRYKEQDFFLRGIIADLGFKSSCIDYTPRQRNKGTSSYSWSRMIALAMSGLTSFSIVPLRLSALVGLGISFFCFMYGLYAIFIRFFIPEYVVSGWSSLLVGIYFLGGIQLLMLGIVGEYIGRIYFETKKRPPYIIRESSL